MWAAAFDSGVLTACVTQGHWIEVLEGPAQSSWVEYVDGLGDCQASVVGQNPHVPGVRGTLQRRPQEDKGFVETGSPAGLFYKSG